MAVPFGRSSTAVSFKRPPHCTDCPMESSTSFTLYSHAVLLVINRGEPAAFIKYGTRISSEQFPSLFRSPREFLSAPIHSRCRHLPHELPSTSSSAAGMSALDSRQYMLTPSEPALRAGPRPHPQPHFRRRSQRFCRAGWHFPRPDSLSRRNSTPV